MKKYLRTAVIVAMILSIVLIGGCGGKKAEAKSVTAKGSAAAEKYKKGTLTTKTFKSKTLNMQFKLPDNYIMAGEDELKSMMEAACKITYKDANDQVIDYLKTNVIYEMMACNTSGNPNLIIIAEKLPLSKMTAKQYVKTVGKQLENQNSGYKCNYKMKNAKICKHNYVKLTLNKTLMGQKLTQDYYCTKIGDRAVSIVLTYTDKQASEAKKLLAGLKKIK